MPGVAWMILGVLGVGIVAALIRVFGRRASAVFRVAIRDGRAELVAGPAPGNFVEACSDVARRSHLARGEVYGVPDGDAVRLRFSGPIPEDDRQRFRNLWGMEQAGPGPTTSPLKRKP